MAKCEAEADLGKLSCTLDAGRPNHLKSRDIDDQLLRQKLQGVLAELGFQNGTVTAFHPLFGATMTARWTVDDATSTGRERSPRASGGTRVTCPICHEHRPAVVLMPCGHVVCRDCQRSKQLRQCPMCRERIASSSRGLFMD